ncbi:signal recognition particle-docking protein FtsY [Mycoplana rhizolycopersici]|uniref:Signal recognition particle receptor FtsY n=1 Tax=Mycoplana rhizolycopersici TaxID=2746702 RepID=A0ABX2QBM6_9HYPH|nr:signal recognition particle-docking protein FtsY [Rhizobium rhizolycopersici]NVP53834.1 signal recognition particle-docking protein FtsY [Rhizobium rhizolycopersici]
MAFGFIKKVFTFGKDTAPAKEVPEEALKQEDVLSTEDVPVPHADAVDAEPLVALAEDRDLLLDEAEAANPEADLHRVEPQADIYPLPPVVHPLPITPDEVAAPEIETAGGPAPDSLDAASETSTPSATLTPEVEATRAAELVNIGLGGVEHAHEEIEAAEAAKAAAIDDFRAADADAMAELAEPSPLPLEEPVEPAPAKPKSARKKKTEAKGGGATTSGAEPVADAGPAPALPKGFSTADQMPKDAPAAVPAPRLSWFQRLRAGLARTSSQLTGQIASLFTKRKLDDATLQDLEDLLIQADLGVETALRITDTLASERYGKDVTGEDVGRIMAGEITKVLEPVAKPLELDLSHKPHVILVVGVNGTGKTTTIGKLAAKLSGAGLKVMMAAGDTFRAAAIEQLHIWADRTKSEIVSSKLGADAAGLAYEAYEQAKAKGSDVLIIDTAGRLQNKAELMAELEKIVRVLGKLDPDAPHTVLQTLDATTGQNAMNQVEIFRNVAGVSGLIMTKLDGTARGGILVAIAAKHKLPVYFIGVGEGIDDLEPFEAKDFAQAIAGVEA